MDASLDDKLQPIHTILDSMESTLDSMISKLDSMGSNLELMGSNFDPLLQFKARASLGRCGFTSLSTSLFALLCSRTYGHNSCAASLLVQKLAWVVVQTKNLIIACLNAWLGPVVHGNILGHEAHELWVCRNCHAVHVDS